MNANLLSERYEKFTSEKNFGYARNSTIGCGGIALRAFYPQTTAELTALTQRLKSDGIGYHVLGNLSNVLPPDGTGKRAVIRMKNFREVVEKGGLYVSAGATSGALLRVCESCGKSGAEFLAGIPCTIGGALYMNAGVSGRYIAELVESVTVLHEGKVRRLSLTECAYAYKSSVFMDEEYVIVGATLRLAQSDGENVREEIKKYLQKRAHLPKGKSMGCVFKNPENRAAGKLIEGAGLKGMRVGGAVVSEQHANFILNDKGASANDVKNLIVIVKNAVYAQYRIRLEEEIRYLQ